MDLSEVLTNVCGLRGKVFLDFSGRHARWSASSVVFEGRWSKIAGLQRQDVLCTELLMTHITFTVNISILSLLAFITTSVVFEGRCSWISVVGTLGGLPPSVVLEGRWSKTAGLRRQYGVVH